MIDRCKKQSKVINVLIASEADRDKEQLATCLTAAGYRVQTADTLTALENAIGSADVIVADAYFSNGALADWLMLWPLPALLITDPDTEPEKLLRLCSDEASSFVIRDAQDHWVRFVPVVIRKMLSIRESVDRQNIHVLRTESSYMNLMRLIPDVVYVLDAQGAFVYINDAIRQLGFEPTELIGKHFSSIVHPEDRPEISRQEVLQRFTGIHTGSEKAPKLFDERRSGDRMTKGLEVRFLQKDNPEWTRANVSAWGEVNANGVNLPEFGLGTSGTIGIIHDISARREAERELMTKIETYAVMLKEIHHRVKNNLQVVSSLLALQGGEFEDEAAAIFESCQTQVQAMALVHEQVYRGSSLQGVDAAAYLARLMEYLTLVFNTESRGITFSIEAGSIVLPLAKAIPLSLILTELITNACKHAFPHGNGGVISVILKQDDSHYELTVRDDGVGFAETAAHPKTEPGRHSIGMDIVMALAAQLGAELHRSSDHGAVTILRFIAGEPGC